MAYNVAVDVGGTFTDVILFDEETGRLSLEKVLSTPDDPSVGIVHGLAKACERLGIGFDDLRLLFHGTTVATNLIIEGKGARVGLLTTKGHEHVLHLARAWTPGPLYGWMQMVKPDPPADLTDTVGIDERIAADGSIVRPLREEEVEEKVRWLVERGVEALAVCFLNAYVNPIHEQRVRDIAQALCPEVPISISSDMVQEYGEYERALTTVINTSVRPRIVSYMRGLERSLEERGFGGTLNIVRSDGGTMSTQAACERPVQIVLSGPSGGAAGAAHLAKTIGILDVLTFDMGGTSTDVSLCLGGQVTVRRDVRLGYYNFKAPAVDVHSVGAGGGSIAYLSISGALQVGPQSAGANPGPACYGFGGTEPTVTDANVVLHRIPPSIKLGGELELDEEAAQRAVAKIAEGMGLSVVEAAQAIIDVVNENMHAALRVVSVERGYDPRRFGLVAFGGAGPVHGNALGRLIGSWPVIIPPTPGVMSAFGFLAADIQNEFSETYLEIAERTPAAALRDRLARLKQQGREWLEQEGVPETDHRFDFLVDCRYYLQNIQIPVRVTLEELAEGGDCSLLRERFEEEHQRRYGFTLRAPIEMATLRVVARGVIKGVSLTPVDDMGDEDASEAIDRYEQVYFGGEWVPTPIYARDRLRPGNVVRGPAIVVQEDTTTVIEPGCAGRVDVFGNILIRPEVG